MSLLRIFWTGFAAVFTLLFVGKFILSAVVGEPVEVLPAAVGLLLLLYLLFTLEGLQVAGLLVKDLDNDAIEQFLEKHPIANSKKILPVHKTFHEHFDGFVVGRQLFVIGTVVAMAFINKSVQLPANTEDVIAASVPIGAGNAQWFTNFLNGGLFAFVTSTLVPSWYSQLLPQFWADGRAISFIALPGARVVLRVAMVLDQIQLGEPGHVVLRIWTRLGLVGQRQVIPIGKQTYYDASLNFYGKAKKVQEVALTLGTPTKVQESVIYLFRGATTQQFEHRIQLSQPIEDDIELDLNLPAGVYAEVAATDLSDTQTYIYIIRIKLNRALPIQEGEEDEVGLRVAYKTCAYSDKPGIPYTAELSSPLPSGRLAVSIEGGKQRLGQPSVRVVEEADGHLNPVPESDGAVIWEITDPAENNNKAHVLLDYPTVATVYQIEFQTMDVDLAPSPKIVAAT